MKVYYGLIIIKDSKKEILFRNGQEPFSLPGFYTQSNDKPNIEEIIKRSGFKRKPFKLNFFADQFDLHKGYTLRTFFAEESKVRKSSAYNTSWLLTENLRDLPMDDALRRTLSSLEKRNYISFF